jgi:hypothetical protein
MKKRARLSVQTLEAREVPAQFGIPWANGQALTVSFAPDGANVDGDANELAALMARSGLSTDVWKAEILRAFQAWAAYANLNIGVVGDSGAALGVSGREQADSRFGDIRIFAVPLDGNVVAITTPPGDLGGTRAGDIILNSNYNFGAGGYNLYTVLLQEAGHAIGVANSPDLASAMYEFYQGPRAGLSGEDAAKAQALYGVRSTTVWEPSGGNDSTPTATVLTGSGTLVTYGDLASTADVDWYKFTASSAAPLTIELRAAGLSLLAGRLEVYDAQMNLVGWAAAGAAGENLTVTFTPQAGAQYFVLVEDAAGTAFDAGQYKLRVVGNPNAPEVVTIGGEAPVDDIWTNETRGTATVLANTGPDGRPSYRSFANLRAGDADYYRIQAPKPGLNQSNVLTATVRSFAGGLAPKITVLNSLGFTVSARVEADGNGLYTVQVDKAASGATYYIKVQAANGGTGAYELRAAFRSEVTSAYKVDSGLLTILNPSKTGTLEVTGSAQIYFQLTAGLGSLLGSLLGALTGPSVVVKIYDSANNLKFQILARAGDTVDGVALLGPGTYRVAVTGNGALLPLVASAFTLKTALMTDPIGSTPTSGTGSPSGYKYKNSSGTTTKTESATTSGTGT